MMVLTVRKHAAAEVPRQQRRKTEPVETVKVDPLVWALALETANGDTKRIEVVSSQVVIVHNS